MKGFNEGLTFAQTCQPIESHPLHGLDAEQELGMRVQEYDDLIFPLQHMLPEFALSEDGVKQLHVYIDDESDDDDQSDDDKVENVAHTAPEDTTPPNP